MDIQQYIASGILEDYVLNLLGEEERREVEQHAIEYPEVRAALSEIEDALTAFAQASALPVTEDLTQKILSKIDEAAEGKSPSPTPRPKSAPNTSNNRSNFWPWAILLLLSILLAAYLFFKNNQLQNQNQTLQNSLANSQNSLDDANQEIAYCENIKNQLDQQLQILRNENNQTVRLTPTPNSPNDDALVFVHYNEVNQSIFLDIAKLPPPPAGKQYQLWALKKDNSPPQSMDVFDLPDEPSLFVSRSFVAEVGQFAISLEDAGGVDKPTNEAIYLFGSV